MTPCSSASALPASTRCAPKAKPLGRRRRRRFHRGTPPIGNQGRHRCRPPRRRARRRHDRHRRCRAGKAARRRGGDDLLPPRQGAHERLRIRAGSGASKGVIIRHWLAPKRIIVPRTARWPASRSNTRRIADGRLTTTGETGVIAADQSSRRSARPSRPRRPRQPRPESGRIAVDGEGRTSLDGVWAGGDCVFGGDDLTVSAVGNGRDAAESINRVLAAGAQPAVAVA
jgi:hypothetical protein